MTSPDGSPKRVGRRARAAGQAQHSSESLIEDHGHSLAVTYVPPVVRISRRETIRLLGAFAAGLRFSRWGGQELTRAPGADRPNLLVIMTDERQDAMSVAGDTFCERTAWIASPGREFGSPRPS